MPIVPSWATGGPVTPRAWSIPGPQPALWRLSCTQRAARQRGDPSSRAAPSRRIVRRSARQPAGRAVNRVLARTTGAATTARVGGWVLPERGVVQPMAIDQPLAPIDEAGGTTPSPVSASAGRGRALLEHHAVDVAGGHHREPGRDQSAPQRCSIPGGLALRIGPRSSGATRSSSMRHPFQLRPEQYR
jgi:hypothetical protein